jgi:PRTRC genetic system protein A
LRYESVRVESCGSGHIRYRRPAVTGARTLAIDLHSHGRHPAFWSPTDDRDDCDDAKLAVVFGDLDAPQPSVKARLLALGAKIDFSEWLASLCDT